MLKERFEEFLKTYDVKSKDKIWKDQSQQARDFWKKRILSSGKPDLTDAEIDKIVRIIDSRGKGNTKETEAIARVMIPQGAWRKLFRVFRKEKKIQKLMNDILSAKTEKARAIAIDELYKRNEGESNYLTGQSGNAINAILAALDPFNVLSLVSLKDRFNFISHFKIPIPEKSQERSIGKKITETNRLILNYFQANGINHNARTISVFCYSKFMIEEWKKVAKVSTPGGEQTVFIPGKDDDLEMNSDSGSKKSKRQSYFVQAEIAKIGAAMGYKIWIPRADRGGVNSKWKPENDQLLESLPFSFSDSVLRTIENIDVIWVSGRSIVRAFEVEHTTSIYSGILRMADLVAMLPNINVKLHIVAPSNRKEKVFEEIQRPVFALLEGGPLSKLCTYLSYESVTEILNDPHLRHLSDTVLEDFIENPE